MIAAGFPSPARNAERHEGQAAGHHVISAAENRRTSQACQRLRSMRIITPSIDGRLMNVAKSPSRNARERLP